MYQVLLFIMVLTLIPHKKWIWSILLLAVNTLYSILILFNTKWTVHFTPDNQFHRGYLGYLPVVISFILLVFILVSPAVCLIPENGYRTRTKLNPFSFVLAAVCFVWGVLCLGAESTFVYFGF
jgi:hypothetical protein